MAGVTLAVLGGNAVLGYVCERLARPERFRRAVAIGLVLAAAVPLGLATVRRNRVYHSVLAMWTDVVAKRPDNARGRGNLATALDEVGRLEEAVEHFRKAVSLMPGYHRAHHKLGNVLHKLRRYDEAAYHFAGALRYNPRSAEGHFNLGTILVWQGKLDQGIAHLRAATRLRPNWAKAQAGLSDALARRRKAGTHRPPPPG